jgi:glycosyltransferase involved in cell wall biosynthesis
VFPSETEGRGLPIIESSACGIPIVCSRYHPQEVFGEVVGEGLPDAHKIRYTMFPEGEFSDEFLTGFARVLTHPEEMRDTMRHNRAAVRARYSQAAFTENLQRLLQRLCKLD